MMESSAGLAPPAVAVAALPSMGEGMGGGDVEA